MIQNKQWQFKTPALQKTMANTHTRQLNKQQNYDSIVGVDAGHEQ